MSEFVHVTLAQNATEQTLVAIKTAIRNKGRGGTAEIAVFVPLDDARVCEINLGFKRISTSPDFIASLSEIAGVSDVGLIPPSSKAGAAA